MDIKIPDLTKLAWQLNVALMGAIFSAISLIYNEKYIYYGFVTFLFGIVSHFFGTWFEFVYSDEKQRSKRARFYIVQSILTVIWIISCLVI
ncbi:hypothetical protein KJ596_03590 [Patescibacteria group bacterium]|nr:hypothetical protein [Patescibacteria group bacterium]MBU1868588.1 hypothetical protein [Patescibacteria group bacterium]